MDGQAEQQLRDRILVRTKRRKQLTVCEEAEALEEILGGLPSESCDHRIASFCRLSPAGFIRFVADRTRIRRLSVATFRLGPRALRMLSDLHGQGRIDQARFVLGRLAASRHKGNNEQEYWRRLVHMCEAFGWEACSIANHTKVTLFDTDDGYYVLEGSGNLNEAPNWEQFSFEQDAELYGFYSGVMDRMFDFAARAVADGAEDDLEEMTEGKGGDGLWQDLGRPLRW